MPKLDELKHGVALCALLSAMSVPGVAFGSATVISDGQTETKEISLSDDDTLTVEEGGTVSIDDDGQAIKLKGKATGVVIENSGLIENTGKDERAIDTSKDSTKRDYSIVNTATGTIRAKDDAIRIDVDITEGGLSVDNTGLIQSTVNGQALDFKSVKSGDVAVTIVNRAGGKILSTDADAIRPGENATVTNHGLIEADSTGDDGNDGIDLRDASTSKVINKTGGIIRGAHQGVNGGDNGEGTVLVLNEEGAKIIGLNGSGIGSDNTGKIVNYGTIQGNYTPSLGVDGDGDGVDIDFYAEIENHGLIEGTGAGGVDSGGQANHAEGVPIGGGIVYNHEGARITGADRGMLVDDGSGGSAYYATQVYNYGQIDGQAGYGIKFAGDFDDEIVNGGLISGANGEAVWMGAGDDVFVILPGGEVEGFVDAETGDDTLKLDAGTKPANVQISSTAFDLGLIGDEATYRHFEGLAVSGAWVLTGSSDFAGSVTVSDGLGAFNGSIANANVVQTGGRVQGTGTIGSLDQNAGTLAPGNSIGILTVSGNYTQAAGSVLEIEADASGNADTLVIAGTAQLAGDLRVLAASGNYALQTDYVILSAQGGISGGFANIADNLAFLDAAFAVSANDGVLSLARNDVSFQSLAETPAQAAFAGAVAASGAGTEPYDALLGLTPEAVQTSYTYATGEQYASQMGAMFDYLNNVSNDIERQIALSEAYGAGEIGVWATGTGSWANYGETDGLAGMHLSMTGVLMGADYSFLPGMRLGLTAGYQDGSIDVDARRSSSDVSTWQLGGYFSHEIYNLGLLMTLSGFYGQGDFDTDRYTVFGTSSATASSGYDMNYANAALDFVWVDGFAGADLPFAVKPYAGIAWSGLGTDGFSETGGSAGNLASDGVAYHAWTGTFGVRLSGDYRMGEQRLVPWADIGLRHVFGDTAATAEFYLESGQPFAIEGLAISRDAADIRVGADYYLTESAAIGVNYGGMFGGRNVGQQAGITAKYQF